MAQNNPETPVENPENIINIDVNDIVNDLRAQISDMGYQLTIERAKVRVLQNQINNIGAGDPQEAGSTD